jgi:hypothetical protein
MAVMVTDISQHGLVMLFTKGLDEPLRGWVKAFKSTTLHEAIMRCQDIKDAVNKKVLAKSFIPQGGKETKIPRNSWTRKDMMNKETRRELRRKKIFFSCKYLWELGHRCMGKGKVYYIEVVSVMEDDGEEEGVGHDSDEPLQTIEQAPLQDSPKGVTIATLSGFPKYYNFRITGIMQGHRIMTLVDSGATHNFIDVALVNRRKTPWRILKDSI